MSSIRQRVPSYQCHHSRQAIVTLQGRDFYLGKFGSLESRAKYDRLIAEYLACGRVAPVDHEELDDAPSVAEQMLPYLRHCEEYDRLSDGRVSNQVLMVKLAFGALRRLYAELPAHNFGMMSRR
jgi:hypothetical protein